MRSLREHINKKTDSILKTNAYPNYRDIVNSIVINELLDLLEYTEQCPTGLNIEAVKTAIQKIISNTYTDIPMKLERYCVNCNCRKPVFKIDDPFVITLDWETDGAILIEKQSKNND